MQYMLMKAEAQMHADTLQLECHEISQAHLEVVLSVKKLQTIPSSSAKEKKAEPIQ